MKYVFTILSALMLTLFSDYNLQKAPLLGQSAMDRFGTITIENINNNLLIKH